MTPDEIIIKHYNPAIFLLLTTDMCFRAIGVSLDFPSYRLAVYIKEKTLLTPTELCERVDKEQSKVDVFDKDLLSNLRDSVTDLLMKDLVFLNTKKPTKLTKGKKDYFLDKIKTIAKCEDLHILNKYFTVWKGKVTETETNYIVTANPRSGFAGKHYFTVPSKSS